MALAQIVGERRQQQSVIIGCGVDACQQHRPVDLAVEVTLHAPALHRAARQEEWLRCRLGRHRQGAALQRGVIDVGVSTDWLLVERVATASGIERNRDPVPFPLQHRLVGRDRGSLASSVRDDQAQPAGIHADAPATVAAGVPLGSERLVDPPRQRRPDHRKEAEGGRGERRNAVRPHIRARIDPLRPPRMAAIDRARDMDELQARTGGIAVAMDHANDARIEPVAFFERNLEFDGLAGRHRIAVRIAGDLQHGCASGKVNCVAAD